MHQDVNVAHLTGLIELSTDINAHRVDDVHLWALFRTSLYFPLVAAFRPERQPPALRVALAQAFTSAATSQGLPRAPKQHALERRTPTHPNGPVVLVASGPTHHVVSNGVHRSPIADRWLELLRASGAPVLKVDVEPSWLSERQPRQYPSVALASVTDAERQLAAEQVQRHWVPALRGMFDDAGRVLRQTVGLSIDAVLSTTADAALQFVAARMSAERWLDAVRPSAVFFICYYETNYLPLIAACRSRGIPTVDLQHGMNGTVHAAYTHWTTLPTDGYAVLPDWYVTWGAHSSENLRRWWPAETTRHQVVVGGRPDLDVDASMPDTPAHRALGDAFTQASRVVVITTQDQLLDAPLIAEMRRAPADWLWLLRPHPQAERIGSATVPNLRAQVSAEGIQNALVVPPAGISLGDLLQHASAHITASSSSWMEAWAYGVSTVFTDPGADALYGLEIAQGFAAHAPHGAGAYDIIAAQPTKGAAARDPRGALVIETGPAAASRALGAIFA